MINKILFLDSIKFVLNINVFRQMPNPGTKPVWFLSSFLNANYCRNGRNRNSRNLNSGDKITIGLNYVVRILINSFK